MISPGGARRSDWKPFNIYVYIYRVFQDCVRKCGSGEEKRKTEAERAACLYIIRIITDTV